MDDPRDRRIAELEAENAELRRRLAQVEQEIVWPTAHNADGTQ